jgi:transposase
MGRKILIKEHLSREELLQLYHSCPDPIEKVHIQLISSLLDGTTATILAKITGYSKQWIGNLAKRYNEFKIEGIKDKRHNNPGSKSKLTDDEKLKLKITILGEPPDGGLWNSTKVAAEISKIIDKPVHPATGWRYLKSLGFTIQSVRPTHKNAASEEEREAFKKNSMRNWKM